MIAAHASPLSEALLLARMGDSIALVCSSSQVGLDQGAPKPGDSLDPRMARLECWHESWYVRSRKLSPLIRFFSPCGEILGSPVLLDGLIVGTGTPRLSSSLDEFQWYDTPTNDTSP